MHSLWLLLPCGGLSCLLNRVMPKTLTYERASQIAPILEAVYTGNINSFSKRLSSDTLIEAITAIYFSVTNISCGDDDISCWSQ